MTENKQFMIENNKRELILEEFEKILQSNTFKQLFIKYNNRDMDVIDLNKVQCISFVHDGFAILSKETKDIVFVFYDTLSGLELIE